MDDVTATKNYMDVMNPSGHTKVEWNPSNPTEVQVARDTFERMTDEGYSAFKLDSRDNQGQRIDEFDPSARRMILVPQLKGG